MIWPVPPLEKIWNDIVRKSAKGLVIVTEKLIFWDAKAKYDTAVGWNYFQLLSTLLMYLPLNDSILLWDLW